MMMDGIGPTYPEAGVIATSPQTAPTAIPTADGFFFLTQSVSIQLTAAPAAARFVTTSAFTASSFALRALPALKPNHPNQRTEANFSWKAKYRSAGIVSEYPRFGAVPTLFSPKSSRLPMNAFRGGPRASVYPHRAQTRLTTAKMAKHWAIVETRFFLRTRPP